MLLVLAEYVTAITQLTSTIRQPDLEAVIAFFLWVCCI